MKKYLLLGALCLSLITVSAQTFRSASNPFYWKNRMPEPGYWQQDVAYKINAKIDEKNHQVKGELHVTYWNNSPDTLNYVFFHLYQNAFQPSSYYHQMRMDNGEMPKYGPKEGENLGTQVTKVLEGGVDISYKEDNTLMRVSLRKPLLPGKKVDIDIDFRTYFDDQGDSPRRMKMFDTQSGSKHYDGVHWYPRVAVYDRKFGWNTNQHLDKEFYGEFGVFDVTLDFPSNYIVGATGTLINRREVLGEELMKKLDIKNFAQQSDSASTVIPYKEGERKVWKYRAENVHDFAFTADPTYRIGVAETGDVMAYALAREENAHGWQNAAEFAAKVIETFSDYVGKYDYPKIIVADAEDGMEYPMLTLDGGLDPDYRSLIVHEIAHMWFFGMLGSNETYRAAMDEGFTQFLNSEGMRMIDGDTLESSYAQSNFNYYNKHKQPQSVKNAEVYNHYMKMVAQHKDMPLNTHSSGFMETTSFGGGYGLVYTKTATMLYALEYVLGDELFQKALKNYVDQWKFAHPYPEDFKKSVIRFTKVDLNWFFDQWMETTKVVDYQIKSVKGIDDQGTHRIVIRRDGDMQMPLDITVTGSAGEQYFIHIPNTWFVKETNGQVMDKWYGWGNFNREYSFEINVPSGIYDVEIDPDNRLGDVNVLNNSWVRKPMYRFDSHISNPDSWEHYEVKMRPDLWYNGYDGLKMGVSMRSGHMGTRHLGEFNLWFNSGILQNPMDSLDKSNFDLLSYRLKYATDVHKLIPYTKFDVQSRFLDGLIASSGGFTFQKPYSNTSVGVHINSLYRKDSLALKYLMYPGEWQPRKWNNFLTLKMTHRYDVGYVEASLRSSTLGSSSQYSFFQIKSKTEVPLGPSLNLRTRVFARYARGSEVPAESQLFLAGANPEEMMDSKYYRSQGFFPHDWHDFTATTNHMHAGGGLNIRGYSGYFAPELMDGDQVVTLMYKGTSGASVNMELEFDQLWTLMPVKLRKYLKFNTYLFGDAGILSFNEPEGKVQLGALRADAGIGTSLTVKKFGFLSDIKPLTIRFDMPLFLNRTPLQDPDYIQFRWILGIGRAF